METCINDLGPVKRYQTVSGNSTNGFIRRLKTLQEVMKSTHYQHLRVQMFKGIFQHFGNQLSMTSTPVFVKLSW